MNNSINLVTMENGDENSARLYRSTNNFNGGPPKQQPHHPSTSLESKTTPKFIQQQQRKPLQSLNANTSVFGGINNNNNDMFRSSSSSVSNISKPFQMAKFHQYTKSDNVEASNHTRHTKDVTDEEESSTISAHENHNGVEKYELLSQDVFRRRLDATDETMEQFWMIQPANPIDESDNEDEYTDE